MSGSAVSAKDLRVSPVTAKAANALVRAGHYSGKVAPNSQLHLGVFLGARMVGALQFGPPMDRRKVLGLVRGSRWDSVVELNRMYIHDDAPRNGESRALAVAFRLLRKHAPQVKWVLSYADGTQCGDGTIYRAAGFALTGIAKNKTIVRLADGSVGSEKVGVFHHRNATPLSGYQFRYIRFLDPTWRSRLTVPEIPFTDIPQECRMYKGVRALDSETPTQSGKGGASPTRTLQSSGGTK